VYCVLYDQYHSHYLFLFSEFTLKFQWHSLLSLIAMMHLPKVLQHNSLAAKRRAEDAPKSRLGCPLRMVHLPCCSGYNAVMTRHLSLLRNKEEASKDASEEASTGDSEDDEGSE